MTFTRSGLVGAVLRSTCGAKASQKAHEYGRAALQGWEARHAANCPRAAGAVVDALGEGGRTVAPVELHRDFAKTQVEGYFAGTHCLVLCITTDEDGVAYWCDTCPEKTGGAA